MIDIKKIAIESQLAFEEDGKLLSAWMSHVDLTEYLEVFAKRIAKECMIQIKEQPKNASGYDDYWQGYTQCSVDRYYAIKECFGVEE